MGPSNLLLGILPLLMGPGLGPADPGTPGLVMLSRQISQRDSRWTVRYQVRYTGDRPLLLSASEIGVDYEAWVANSHCRPHTVPRRTEASFTLAETNQALVTVIDSPNELLRCRERIALGLSVDTRPAEEAPLNRTSFLPVELAPGQAFWLYLALDHEHFLHGKYDPLLGDREVRIKLGPCQMRDVIPLDTERTPATPVIKLSTPPRERLDEQQFHTAPHSLYLAADVPGYQYFRFDDMPVRYGTSFRISFWYLVAVGTEGTCHARIMEYQDTPNAWHRLDGGFDQLLPTQGHWERFEHTFRTLRDTTTIALDFRIIGANVGEVWIDDIELMPLYADSAKP